MERMENVTLRLNEELRKVAEKSAADAHWSLAEELRFVLQMHYQGSSQFVTVDVLQEMFRDHERKFHGAIMPLHDIEDSYISAESNHDVPKVQILEVLSELLSILQAGEEPTPSQIGESVNMDYRTIGKILKPFGIEAKHTTINRIPGRYYTKDLLPRVEAALKILSHSNEGN